MSTPEIDGDRATQELAQDAQQTLPPAQNAVVNTSPQRPTVHEADILPTPSGPRLFGTGSYGMGGTHAEGSDALGDLNPLGGYGTFNDAGGPGSTTLYGEPAPAETGTPPEADATDSPQAPPAESTP